MKTIKIIAIIIVLTIPNLLLAQAPKDSKHITVEGTKEQLIAVLIDNFYIVHDNGNQVYTELKSHNLKANGFSHKIVVKIKDNKITLSAGGYFGTVPFQTANKGMKGSVYFESFAELDRIAKLVNENPTYE